MWSTESLRIAIAKWKFNNRRQAEIFRPASFSSFKLFILVTKDLQKHLKKNCWGRRKPDIAQWNKLRGEHRRPVTWIENLFFFLLSLLFILASTVLFRNRNISWSRVKKTLVSIKILISPRPRHPEYGNLKKKQQIFAYFIFILVAVRRIIAST